MRIHANNPSRLLSSFTFLPVTVTLAVTGFVSFLEYRDLTFFCFFLQVSEHIVRYGRFLVSRKLETSPDSGSHFSFSHARANDFAVTHCWRSALSGDQLISQVLLCWRFRERLGVTLLHGVNGFHCGEMGLACES